MQNLQDENNSMEITLYDENGEYILKAYRKELEWQSLGLTKTLTGYGRKIESVWKVLYNGRNYRIYYDQISNVASHYIIVGGTKKYIR